MDDEVRWGIIGSGDVAEHKGGPVLYNVEGSRLVAVMSRRAEKAADFARRHGAERHYDSVEGLLADEEVNAVYVATPPASHLEITAAADRTSYNSQRTLLKVRPRVNNSTRSTCTGRRS